MDTRSRSAEARQQHPHDGGALPCREGAERRMAAQMAALYQQQFQMAAQFQQQRCQAWANAYRERCQKLMQGAMLVVAWYVRDRITRRRKKQRRNFRQGLQERWSSPSKVTKNESIRKWVRRTAEDTHAQSPASPASETFLDQDEADFDMDKAASASEDTRAFGVADRFIKSQQGKMEVPLLGKLSFDESDDSDSEQGREDADSWDGDGDLEMEEDDYLYEDDDEDEDEDASGIEGANAEHESPGSICTGQATKNSKEKAPNP